MLHAMAGLVEVDAGSIFVDGQDLDNLSDAALTRFRRANIGLVFQAFNLIPLLSAKDNVRLPGMELPDIDQKVNVLLERLGMQDPPLPINRTHSLAVNNSEWPSPGRW